MTAWLFLKFLHFSALALTCLCLGAMCMIDKYRQPLQYKAMMKCHGISLITIFISGVALVKYMQFPIDEPWLYAKVGVWFLLGAMPTLLYKLADMSAKYSSVHVKLYFVLFVVTSAIFFSTTRLELYV